MSGETGQNVSAWTIDSLKEHVEGLMDERDRRYEQRFLAQAEAVAVADRANEKRFDSVNEFRETLSDQARSFMPRSESESKHKNLQEKVDDLAHAMGLMLSRTEYDRAHVELIQKVDAINATLLDKIDNLKQSASIPRSELEARFMGLDAKLASTIPRTEVAQRMAGVDTALATVNSRLDTAAGTKQGVSETRAAVYAFAGFLVALIVIGGFVAAVWPK